MTTNAASLNLVHWMTFTFTQQAILHTHVSLYAIIIELRKLLSSSMIDQILIQYFFHFCEISCHEPIFLVISSANYQKVKLSISNGCSRGLVIVLIVISLKYATIFKYTYYNKKPIITVPLSCCKFLPLCFCLRKENQL